MRRTTVQEHFDHVKHGWAFCDKAMLRVRLPRLRELAKQLSKNDERHETLKIIEKAVKS